MLEQRGPEARLPLHSMPLQQGHTENKAAHSSWYLKLKQGHCYRLCVDSMSISESVLISQYVENRGRKDRAKALSSHQTLDRNNNLNHRNNKFDQTNSHLDQKNSKLSRKTDTMAQTTVIIDQRLPGRVGCPILPVFPVETRSYRGDDQQHLSKIQDNVKDILAKYDIDLCYSCLVWRNSDGEAAAKRQLTLVLETKTELVQQRWVDAVKDIRSLLQESEIHWSIELIESQMLLEQITTFPVLSTDRQLIEGWKKARPDFFANLQGRDWVAVDVLYRGTTYRKYPTVMVSARDANDSAAWDATLMALRKVLQDYGVDARIELLFSKGVSLMAKKDHIEPHIRTLPVLSTDRQLIEGWKKARPDFFANLQGRDWVAVDVLYRGTTDRKYPIVTVSARDANDSAAWDATLMALRKVLQDYGVDARVEILPAEGITPAVEKRDAKEDRIEDRTEPHFTTVKYDFYKNFNMGTSCGVSGSDITGTLGGWIRLKKGPATLELGLTNYHVLKDGLLREDSPFPPIEDLSYGKVVSPSDSDHKRAKTDFEKEVKETQKKFQGFQETLENVSRDDPIWKKSFQFMDTVANELDGYRKKLDSTNNSREIGSIYSASGFRTRDNLRYLNQPGKSGQHEGWATDWCLVQVEEPACISRKLELRGLPSTFEYMSSQDEGEDVTQYCSISANKNYKVAKRGRTSGWTDGVLSAIDSTARLDGKDPKLDRLPTNQRIELRDKFQEKLVSVHTIAGTKKELFISPGDSGAFVFLNEPPNTKDIKGFVIIGMVFASNTSNKATYMMPMDLIVDDIEEVTGGKVVEPHFAGELN